jgi:hypothetical protein
MFVCLYVVVVVCVCVRWIEFFLVGKKKGLVGASFGILIFVCLFVCLLACLSVFVACARWIEFFQVGRPKEFGILFVLLLL